MPTNLTIHLHDYSGLLSNDSFFQLFCFSFESDVEKGSSKVVRVDLFHSLQLSTVLIIFNRLIQSIKQTLVLTVSSWSFENSSLVKCFQKNRGAIKWNYNLHFYSTKKYYIKNMQNTINGKLHESLVSSFSLFYFQLKTSFHLFVFYKTISCGRQIISIDKKLKNLTHFIRWGVSTWIVNTLL